MWLAESDMGVRRITPPTKEIQSRTVLLWLVPHGCLEYPRVEKDHSALIKRLRHEAGSFQLEEFLPL